MVLKYSKDGFPYREPPYSKEELREIESTLYNPPASIYRGPRSPPSRTGPQGSEEQQPGEARPEPRLP
jgi:hypothetical protein